MLINEIKERQLIARKLKCRDTSLLLTTIIGEAEMVGKSIGNRPSTDDEVLKVLRKFESNILSNIKIFESNKIANLERMSIAYSELILIRQFLPKPISDIIVSCDIVDIIELHELKLEMKSLGVINKHLKIKYGNRFDGKQSSKVFGGIISNVHS